MGKLAVITTNNKEGIKEDLYPVTIPEGVIDPKDKTPLSDDLHKIKDKEYNKPDYSGLGRVFLKKNIKDGKSILTQDMINKSNTIYIIEYDFDLNGEEITIPEGCVLDFSGGSLNNGSISFNNTKLQGDIKLPLSVQGIIDNEEYNVKWFGAKGDDATDDTQVLNWCFNNLPKVYIPNGIYNITNIVIENPYYGKRWRGDLAYSNEYVASSGASVVFRHIGSGNMIEFKDNLAYVEIYNICLVPTKNTTNAIYFDKEHQATFFKTEGLNIWAKDVDKTANGISLGKGFAISFNNFCFSGLNTAIEIPYSENGWFTEAMLGSTNNSYIIDCNQAFSFHYGNDIIINNVIVEKVGKVIDVISHGENRIHVTLNNCYFEDYAQSGEYTFNIMDTDTGMCAGLLLNNCNFLYNTLGSNIFKSNGNLILQNNKGLNISKDVVNGRFVSLFNDEFYTAFRRSYNLQNDIGLYQVDWHNFLGSKNFAISDKFAMGHPNGDINYPQSLKIVRRFKVSANEISKDIVNVPIIYFPFENSYLSNYKVNISILFPNNSYDNLYVATGYGTTNRWLDMTLKEEIKKGNVSVTPTRYVDNTNQYTTQYITLGKMETGMDMFIDVEINVFNAYLHIQPTYGVMAAIDNNRYIPNSWRMYVLGQDWKMYDSSTETWIDIP